MDTEILNKFREFVKDFIKTSASNIKAEDSLCNDKVIHEKKFDPGFGYITFTVLEVNDVDDIDAPLFKVFASDYNGEVGSSFKSFSRWHYVDKSNHLINVNQYVLDSMKQAVKNLSSKTKCRLLVDEIEKAINSISNDFLIVTNCDKGNDEMVEDSLTTPLGKLCYK